MSARIIADSDGDQSESSNASPDRPSNRTHRSQESQPVKADLHPSTSTDPSFFKDVFDEQQEAALQQLNVLISRGVGMSEATDIVSFDQGFERTVAGQDERSLWDVPSSPEVQTPKQAKNQSNTARTKMTRGMKRQLDHIGYISEDDDFKPPSDITSPKSKRNRAGLDSDDFVPTLPICSEERFVVAPSALSTSQKKEYLSVQVQGHSSPLQALKSSSINVKSSGTSTNINTPRSDSLQFLEPQSSDISRRSKSASKKRSQTTRLPSLENSLDPNECSERSCQDESTDFKHVAVPIPDENGKNAQCEDPPTKASQEYDCSVPGEDEQTGALAKPRSRGRPKKGTKETSTEAATSAPKTKKRRGRPKKSQPADSENVERSVAESELHPHQSPEATEPQAPNGTESQPHETEAKQCATSEGVLTATEDGTEEAKSKSARQHSNLGKAFEEKIQDIRRSAPCTKDLGQPAYRVGLSKRLRIAPLLKVIRK